MHGLHIDRTRHHHCSEAWSSPSSGLLPRTLPNSAGGGNKKNLNSTPLSLYIIIYMHDCIIRSSLFHSVTRHINVQQTPVTFNRTSNINIIDTYSSRQQCTNQAGNSAPVHQPTRQQCTNQPGCTRCFKEVSVYTKSFLIIV